MAERTLMLPDVRVSLAEREIEFDLLVVANRSSIVDQRLERREVPVAEGDVPATEQIDIEPGPPRRYLDGSLESTGRLIDPADLLQYTAEIVVRRIGTRRNRKRLLAMIYGLLVPVQCLKRGRAVYM